MKFPEPTAPPSDAIADGYSSKVDLTTNFNVDISQNGSKDTLEPYRPADHRETALTSSAGTLAHLLKASLGSGVLAMPLAFRNAGLGVGVAGTLFVGGVCAHSLHILVRTSQEVCVESRQPALGYAATCYRVFQAGPPSTRKLAPFARHALICSAVADWALAATHMGACCVYVVLVAESFKQVSDVYGGPAISLPGYCAMCLVPLVPLTQITKLKYLVPFSTLANFVWLGSICISLYYCFTDMPGLTDRDLYTSLDSLPLFVCTSLFAMEGVGIVMPVENEMAKPEQFLGCPGVLNIAMSTVVMLYGFVGFVGYLKYGDEVRGSLTLNLPQDQVLAQTAKIMVALVLMLSYALIFYVPVDVVWRRIKHKINPARHTLAMSVVRIAGVLITVGLASAIPRLELFMELVGAVCLSVLGLLLPAATETVWRWSRGLGRCCWVLWKNLLIVLLALFALIFGSFYAILGLVRYLNDKGE